MTASATTDRGGDAVVAMPGGNDGKDHRTAGAGKESQATAIVRLVKAGGAELWHTPGGDGYMTIVVDGHRQHHPLNSRADRDYLTRLYYMDARKAPSATAMQAAIATLSGIARYDGAQHDVHLRVGGSGDTVYLDLADPQWRSVEITSAGWRGIDNPPVRFRRTRGMLPLPLPVSGGSIAELREYVNVASDDAFALVVCWLVQTYRPSGPYPVLVLMGEQGCAKTTTGRVLRRLVDPNVSDVRSEPREARDLAVAADNGHIIAFDNLSHLPPWLSDALCRLATGGGFSTRTLYENREEEIFDAVRPVVLNGISEVATRPDLIDRAIVETLPMITDRQRRPEADFWLAFEQARPRILGAVLDAVVMALRCYAGIQLEITPRMADFAIWSAAAEPACPWPQGTFIRAYTKNRQGAIEAALDGDPVVEVVRKIAPWKGTATDLLSELNQRTPEAITKRKDWFSRPRQVSDALRRLAPGLRKTGIEVAFTKEPHTRRRLVTIEKGGSDPSPSSPSSHAPDSVDFVGAQGADASPDSSPDSPNVSGPRDAGDAGDAEKPVLSDEGYLDFDPFGKARERNDV